MIGGRPRRAFSGTPSPTSQPRVAVLHPHFVRPLSGGALASMIRRVAQRPFRVEKMRERVAERERHADGKPRLIRQPQLSRSAVLVAAGGSCSGYDVESRNPAAAVGASAHVASLGRLGVVGRASRPRPAHILPRENARRLTGGRRGFRWWRGRDSNPRPLGYEPNELPLLHPATSGVSGAGALLWGERPRSVLLKR